MTASLRPYRNTVLILWLLGIIGGTIYASTKSIPGPVTAAVLAAMLVEMALYVAPGFEGVRERLMRLPAPALAAGMTASAVPPLLIYTLPLGLFEWKRVAVLLVMAAVVSFWYVLLSRRPVFDVAFVVMMASPILLKAFSHIYPEAAPKLRLDILGQVMWIRLGIAATLLVGRTELPGGFRFLPTRKDWSVGLRHFAYFLPLAFVLGGVLRVARFEAPKASWYVVLLVAVATFFGILWVVALSEEFFFRGLLQEWIGRWTGLEWIGLAAASLLFGAVHLPFRGFPNWRFAILAALAGLFYGRAFAQARSIRAAMVAHALVVTTWKMFFR